MQPQYGHDMSSDELRAVRGTPQETLQRIRTKHEFDSDVSDLTIFERCFLGYRGASSAAAYAEYQRYQQYLETGEPDDYQLPWDVVRAGDPDTNYPTLCNRQNGTARA